MPRDSNARFQALDGLIELFGADKVLDEVPRYYGAEFNDFLDHLARYWEFDITDDGRIIFPDEEE